MSITKSLITALLISNILCNMASNSRSIFEEYPISCNSFFGKDEWHTAVVNYLKNDYQDKLSKKSELWAKNCYEAIHDAMSNSIPKGILSNLNTLLSNLRDTSNNKLINNNINVDYIFKDNNEVFNKLKDINIDSNFEDLNKLKVLQDSNNNKINNNVNNNEVNYKDLVKFNPEKLLPIVEKYWNDLVTHNGKYILNSKLDLKPSVEFINKEINNSNINVNKEELNNFLECLKQNNNINNVKDIYSQVLSNYYYNVKAFKFVSNDKNINFFNYFYAINNSIKNWLNNNNVKDIQDEILKDNKPSNNLLNEIANLYLDYVTNNIDEKKIETFLEKHKELNIHSLANEFLNFYTLGFNNIINQIIKYTLLLKDINPKLNNKLLQTLYESGDSNNNIICLQLENYNLGVCWLNTAFETIYTIASNKSIIKNAIFDKFTKYLKDKQFERVNHVKSKNSLEQFGNYRYKMTNQINILKEFGNFIEYMKTSYKAEYDKWMEELNSNKLSKKALDEINKLISEDSIAEQQLHNNLAQGINHSTYKSFGNDSRYGISLFCNLFPELKQLFEIKYDKDSEDNIDSTSKEPNSDKINILEYFYNNITSPIYNVSPIKYTVKQNKDIKLPNQITWNDISILPNRIQTRYFSNTTNVNINTHSLQHDIVKHVTELPEYITIDINNKKNVENTIVRITESGEVLIYKLSNLVKKRKDIEHNYAIYYDPDGAKLMDDHNYYHLSHNNTDPTELAIYKQVYKGILQEQVSKESVDDNKKLK